MDRNISHNLIVFPFAAPIAGPACYHALSSTRNLSSAHTHFFENHCVLRATDYPCVDVTMSELRVCVWATVWLTM